MFSTIHSNFGMGYNFTYLVMTLEALLLDALNTNIDKPSLREKYIPPRDRRCLPWECRNGEDSHQSALSS